MDFLQKDLQYTISKKKKKKVCCLHFIPRHLEATTLTHDSSYFGAKNYIEYGKEDTLI